MGLDIYHQRATLEKPDKIDPYAYNSDVVIREEYEGFNVPFEHFNKYIQQVEYAIIDFTIIIVKDKHLIDSVKAWFKEYDYPILFFENAQELDDKINEYEVRENLKFCNKHLWETTDYRGINYFHYELQTGFYVEEIGYQRKGINGSFWKRFYSEDIFNFALKEDFNYAYSCVGKYWTSDTKKSVIERRQKFKEDFVDKFEFGASYLSLSY